MDAGRIASAELRALSNRMMRSRFILMAAAALIVIGIAACTPDKALDFGPTGEINTLPEDQLSRDILRDFDGRDFTLTDDDRQAHIRLTDWAPNRRIIVPFWLGINPLYPGFLRPTVGHIYVMSESIAG